MDDWAAKKLAELHARAPKKRKARAKKYAYLPLPWGFRALTVAGRGAALVAYALHMQRTKHKNGDVPITAAVLKRCGVNRKTRGNALDKLEAAGLATVRRRGKKFQGCPLLTMLLPEQRKESSNDDGPN